MTRIPRRSGYCGKVISLGPIAHWPLYDLTGTIARNSMNTFNTILDGTYTGVTLQQPGIGDGFNSVLFDGATNYCNIYSSGFANAFNGALGTLATWFRVSSSSVWTDNAAHAICYLQVDANNYILLWKAGSGDANKLEWSYNGSGTSRGVTLATTPTTWQHMAITWDKAANQLIAYINGVQTGTTQSGFGVFSGSLAATTTVIGAATTTPTQVWSGYLAHVAVWNRALTATEILSLATVP